MILHDNRFADRLTIAANDLTCRELDPEFAGDGASVVFVAGPPLTNAALVELANCVAKTGVDMIHLAFNPEDEAAGPQQVTVLAERWGVVLNWPGCVLWAPPGRGPLVIAQRGGDANFAHDGRALINVERPASATLQAGETRARRRLRAAAAKVTKARLETVTVPMKQAA